MEANDMEHLDRQLARTVAVLESLDRQAVERLCREVRRTHERGGTVFICGNGGSAATASHFCQDLGKGTMSGPADARRLRVLALNDNVSALTAWANDCGYEAVFEQPLRALGRPGDLLIAISGSGDSPNVLNAVRYANGAGIATFGLTGFDGGKLKDLARDGLHVDVADMEVAENAHMIVAHLVVCTVRAWKRERDAAPESPASAPRDARDGDGPA
jgi:D-sedoheptulose 7-phosphate isomerase